MTTTYYLAALLIIGLPLAYFAGKRMGYAEGRDIGRREATRWARKEIEKFNDKLRDTQESATQLREKAELLRERKP